MLWFGEHPEGREGQHHFLHLLVFTVSQSNSFQIQCYYIYCFPSEFILSYFLSSFLLVSFSLNFISYSFLSFISDSSPSELIKVWKHCYFKKKGLYWGQCFCMEFSIKNFRVLQWKLSNFSVSFFFCFPTANWL